MSLELNKIYCENCLETMKRMPDEFIDLTVTSPPYDDMDEDFNPIPKNGMRDYNGYSWDFKAIARELFRTTKTGGVVVWVVNDPVVNGSKSLASSLQRIYFRMIGFNIHDVIIYQKKCYPFPPSNRYFDTFEYSIVLSKSLPMKTNIITVKTIWKNDKKTTRQKNGSLKLMKYDTGKDYRIKDNVWVFEVGYLKSSTDKIAFAHPATFPEKLVKDHIYSWSNEGDLVYDPFMGSGTVAKMAHLMKRNWIGSEISQEYVDLAYKRIDPYLRQATLF